MSHGVPAWSLWQYVHMAHQGQTNRGLDVTLPDYGAVGDGVTDDSAAVQAAFTAAAAAGSSTFFPPGKTFYLGDTTVTSEAAVWMGDGAKLTYAGTGTALILSGVNNTHNRLWVQRANFADAWWQDLGAENTSIGVQVVNSKTFALWVNVLYFATGLELMGDNAGCGFGRIFCESLAENKRGLRFNSTNEPTGWSNQHTVFGRIVNSDVGGTTPYVGSKHLDMQATNTSGNTFVGMDLEGSNHERTMDVGSGSTHNLWLNCRFEGNPANSLYFQAGGNKNVIIHGWGLDGPGDSMVSDLGTNNRIVGDTPLEVTGSAGGNVALQSLLTQLESLGFITDSST